MALKLGKRVYTIGRLGEELRGDLWDSTTGSPVKRLVVRRIWQGLWRDFQHPAFLLLNSQLHRLPRSSRLALGHLPGVEGWPHPFRQSVRGQLEQLNFLQNRTTPSSRLTIRSLLTSLHPTHRVILHDDLRGPDAPTW